MGAVDAGLALSALLMGLAGVPHCAAMCGATCTAVTRARAGRQAWHAMAAWQLGRLLGYALAGAAVAASLSWLARWGQEVAWLRPLWGMVHAAALALGLGLLWRGRQPAWLEGLGRQGGGRPGDGTVLVRFRAVQGPARASVLGALWVAWPCGLLQSALVVAALAGTAHGGAVVMGTFAAASGLGLWLILALGPRLWSRIAGSSGAPAPVLQTAAVRLAGATLAGASGWALWHGLYEQIAALCA